MTIYLRLYHVTQMVESYKMAEGDKIPSSASVANSDNKIGKSWSKIEKSSFLFYNVKNFTWKGDLNSLKTFVAVILKYDDGKWPSPRGEEKLFKSANFSLKWHGPKKEKLQIMKDNEDKSLQSAIEACKCANKWRNKSRWKHEKDNARGRRRQQTTRSEAECRWKSLGVRKLWSL